MDNLQAPLLYNRRLSDGNDSNDSRDSHDHVADRLHNVVQDEDHSRPCRASPGIFMYLLTCSAGISGLLFGYDTGVISATLVSIRSSLSGRTLTSLDKSVITSSTSFSALLVSPFSSHLADRLGRKRIILYADLLFIVGALLQSLSSTVAAMVLGRSVVGAAVGAASFVTPLYIAELAPAAYRGRLVTMNILFVTFGQVVAYLVGWVFAEHSSEYTGWRWMVGLGAAPAALQTALVLLMPETPRWLMSVGRTEEARLVVMRIGGANSEATACTNAALTNIAAEVREDQTRTLEQDKASWLSGCHALLAVRRNRRALIIACLLQGLQQLCGFNSLMYFSATMFMLLGFSSPTLASMSVAMTNFTFTIVALAVIDHVGRRRTLLHSIPFMILGLLLSAYGFSFIKQPPARQAVEVEGGAAAGLVLGATMLYVAAYAVGLGNVPWMQGELFSDSSRSLGSGAATATNWASNFVVGLTFLPLMDALSPSWTFVLYGVVCAGGLWLVYLIYPETSGLSLEEAAGLLDRDDWGVAS